MVPAIFRAAGLCSSPYHFWRCVYLPTNLQNFIGTLFILLSCFETQPRSLVAMDEFQGVGLEVSQRLMAVDSIHTNSYNINAILAGIQDTLQGTIHVIYLNSISSYTASNKPHLAKINLHITLYNLCNTKSPSSALRTNTLIIPENSTPPIAPNNPRPSDPLSAPITQAPPLPQIPNFFRPVP